VTEQWTAKLLYIAYVVFRTIQNHGEQSYFRRFQGNDRTDRSPWSAPGLESCARRVNPRWLPEPAFAKRVNPHCFAGGRVRVELAAGRARHEKFFVRINEC